MLDKTATIESFLEAAAAKQPTPGGGSVAALAGALAAAMGEMVLNYSVGKKRLEGFTPQLNYALTGFHQAREAMLKLILDDQSAYEALTSARKMPADDPKREVSIFSATMLCIEIPQGVAIRAIKIMTLAAGVVDIANRYLLSDLAVCAELAMATTRAALCNVRVNLPGVSDVRERRRIEAECEKLLTDAVALIKLVIPRIWERVSKG